MTESNDTPNPQQQITASEESSISNVIQALVSGQVAGDLHIGNRVYTRSRLEELQDYLAHAVAVYETRMLRAVPRRPPVPTTPYKFLYAFDMADAPLFFGRNTAIDALSALVCQQRLTVLHGRSGAGKTSLLHAGLAPHLLDTGYLPIVVRATGDPVLAVKRTLAPPSLGPWPALLPDISLHVLLGLVRPLLSCPGQELVVIFDQFEEFLTALPPGEPRQPFIDILGDCCEDTALPVRFLLSIRGDFFGDLATFERRLPQIFHTQYRLKPLTRDEASAAIQQPLARLHPPVACDPDLLTTLLNDLARTGMELPHLQIVCTRLYATRHPDAPVLTLAHYHALGGATTILGDYLRHEVERLHAAAPLARAVLISLVTPDHTRRMLTEATLRTELIQRSDLDQLPDLLAALVTARLLRRESNDGVIQYELAHDYLVGEVRA